MRLISSVAVIAVAASALLSADPTATTADGWLFDRFSGRDKKSAPDTSNPFPTGNYCGSYMFGILTARIETSPTPPTPLVVVEGGSPQRAAMSAQGGGGSADKEKEAMRRHSKRRGGDIEGDMSKRDVGGGDGDGSSVASPASGTLVVGSFDLTVKAMSYTFSCPGVQYILDQTTGHAQVPDATNERSCLGSLLARRNVALDVEYHGGRTNQVKLSASVANVWLSPCA